MPPHTTQNSQHVGFKELFHTSQSSPNLQSVSSQSTPENMSAVPPNFNHNQFHYQAPSHQSTSHHPQHTPTPSPSHTSALRPPDEARLLAQVVDAIMKSNVPKTHPCEPNLFDGSNSHKLHTFIVQCRLNFWEHPDLFQDGTSKVNYMLSSLEGSTLECFKPTLLDPIEPPWISDFNLFLEELHMNFGVYDSIREAKAEIEDLHMQENHQAKKYFIKFTQLATCVSWGQATLQRQAYKGLAKHIKNDMVHHDKLKSLAELQKLIQNINAQYWE